MLHRWFLNSPQLKQCCVHACAGSFRNNAEPPSTLLSVAATASADKVHMRHVQLDTLYGIEHVPHTKLLKLLTSTNPGSAGCCLHQASPHGASAAQPSIPPLPLSQGITTTSSSRCGSGLVPHKLHYAARRTKTRAGHGASTKHSTFCSSATCPVPAAAPSAQRLVLLPGCPLASTPTGQHHAAPYANAAAP
jgi:hypothetical protein